MHTSTRGGSNTPAPQAPGGQEWQPEQHLVTASAPEQSQQFLDTPHLRGSVKAITSEAEKNLYKGSVVMVSASYRPSSKVVVRGGGVCGGSCASGKKIFFYIPVAYTH